MDERNEFQKRIGVGERQYRFGQYAGRDRLRVVRSEIDGKPAGHQLDHWDGRLDATVYARTVEGFGRSET